MCQYRQAAVWLDLEWSPIEIHTGNKLKANIRCFIPKQGNYTDRRQIADLERKDYTLTMKGEAEHSQSETTRIGAAGTTDNIESEVTAAAPARIDAIGGEIITLFEEFISLFC
jgi:hypothetical protein